MMKVRKSKMTKYATRVWNDEYEEHSDNIMALAHHYGLEEIKDKGRLLFFVFNTRQQANDFANEIFESYKINTKAIEWC